VSSWIERQIRDAQIAGAGFLLILASAVLGMVWLSIALARMLGAAELDPALAALCIAALCLAPLGVFYLVRALRSTSEPAERHQALAAQPEGFAEISRFAEDMAGKSPLTAVAVAMLAGLLAARFPSALSLLAQIVTRRDSR
jgi:fructose-specific phosphotransferase system IIC component